MVRRCIRAFRRRVGEGDIDGLADLKAMRDELDQAISDAVTDLRMLPKPYSWDELGRALGVTRQGAIKRYATDATRGARGGQPTDLR